MPLQLSTFSVPELVERGEAELEPIIMRSKLTVTLEAAEGSAADHDATARR